jgi:methylenetetrahydrofolate dehydrogenase (NADP+)/methenyltetrahydrofolate cyclohydrolase
LIIQKKEQFMAAIILDGQQLAHEKRHALMHACQRLNYQLRFVVFLIGSNLASEIYVQRKRQAALKVGIDCVIKHFDDNVQELALLAEIEACNQDKTIHGMIVQLPLPKHINSSKIIESIAVNKDIDGFHPYNLGRLALGEPLLRSCTPYGIIQLLEHYKIDLKAKNCLVIGASRIVGRPMMLELLAKKATPTICHSQTKGLDHLVHHADIIITATGHLDIIHTSILQGHQVLIDVGIHRMPDNSIRGDINFKEALNKVAYITPVPGGVGPMTVSTLLQNVLAASKLQARN